MRALRLLLAGFLTLGVSATGAVPVNPGQLGPLGIVIGPLPASSMPGQFAQTIPTMANFQYLLDLINTLSSVIVTPVTYSLTVESNGSIVQTGVNLINFTGAGQSAAGAGPGAVNISIPGGGGGGAPIDASYLVLGLNSVLTQERVLTAGTNISFVDTGPNGTLTINASAGAGVALPFIFGSGRDGAVVLDGVFVPPWATLAGSVYSMSRNAHCTNLTINSGISLNLHQFLLYVNGTLTGIDPTSVIRNKGLNGANGSGGGGGAGGNSDGSGGSWSTAGSQGGTGGAGGQNGGNATAVNSGMGGTGGAGGGAGAFVGGQGPTTWAVLPESNTGGINFGYCLNTISLELRWLSNNASGTVNGGGGGGGGASAGAFGQGGGGGGSGGCACIFAAVIAGSGTIDLSGGNGGNGFTQTTIASAGGGGGGGGYLALWTKTANVGSIWTITVAGGTGGTGVSGGANGTAGTAGNFALFVII